MTQIFVVKEACWGWRITGLDIEEAVNGPRFHEQWMPDEIRMEGKRFSPDTVRMLEEEGNKVRFGLGGGGECIEIDLGTRESLGGSDGRNETGAAVGY